MIETNITREIPYFGKKQPEDRWQQHRLDVRFKQKQPEDRGHQHRPDVHFQMEEYRVFARHKLHVLIVISLLLTIRAAYVTHACAPCLSMRNTQYEVSFLCNQLNKVILDQLLDGATLF
jgi:hypothetical protein